MSYKKRERKTLNCQNCGYETRVYEGHICKPTPPPEESTLREEILDIIYNQFSFPNSVVNKSSRSARKFDHEKQADKLLKLIQERERLARLDEIQKMYLHIAEHDGRYVKTRCLEYLNDIETQLRGKS